MWDLTLAKNPERVAEKIGPAELWAERAYVLRVARAIVLDVEAAEDLAQEALVRALKAKEPIRELRPFLRTLTARLCLNHLRRKRPVPLPEDQPEPENPIEERLQIERTLLSLPADSRTILALALGEGLSYAEIGEILGIPAGTVASRLNAARKAFKNHWGDDEDHA